MDRIKNMALATMTVLIIIISLIALTQYNSSNKYSDQLTSKDEEIQKLNTDLGISESKILKESELNKKFKSELENFNREFGNIIDEYNLRLQSRDKTIANLNNKIKGGTTTVIINETNTVPEQPQSISYEWTNSDGRFKLTDPDIFIFNNEEFSAKQHISILGHILYGKDGQLQIRKVELREVIPDGIDKSGKVKYKNVGTSTIKLVDSQFEYTNNLPTQEKHLLDIFNLRLLVSYDTQLTPGLGLEFANIGNFVDYLNIGINTKVSTDLTNPFGGSLNSSRVGIGFNYKFIPPLLDTNLAIGVGLSTPFNDFGSKFILTADAILYITN